MRFQTLPIVLASTSLAVAQNASTSPGYTGYPDPIASTLASNSSLSFGQNYAVLNLDLINGLVSPLASTPAGSSFIASTASWIDAVHALSPPPLSIFTRIYFSNARKPEVKPGSGFEKASAPLTTANASATQIYPAFHVDEAAGDVVLQKTRYYAGTGNALEEILRAQGIDTVILSGVRTSGVILSTAYRLFDLDYNVYVSVLSSFRGLIFLLEGLCLLTKRFRYVISNNTIETPPDTPGINAAILEGVIPKLPANVISVEQAIEALGNSGPAVY